LTLGSRKRIENIRNIQSKGEISRLELKIGIIIEQIPDNSLEMIFLFGK